MESNRKKIAVVFVAAVLGVSVLAVPAGATTGEWFIDSNTTLAEDHVGTIGITAPGITLDCNGYSVIASGDEGNEGEWTAGIAAWGVSDVTIRNCHVDGGVTNPGNMYPGDEGFEGGFSYGILLHDSDGSTIVSNSAINNNHSGISVGDFSNNNIVRENSASNNLFGLVTSADNNTFTNNTVTENVDGFVIHQADHNVFRDNHADQNSEWGFSFYESSFNTAVDNTASNGQSGFALNSSHGNVIEDNTLTDNVEDGISIYESSGNEIFGNSAIGNHRFGFFVNSSEDNTLVDNAASQNEVGFLLFLAADTAVRDNRAEANQSGIAIQDSSFSTVVDNRALGNGLYGFWEIDPGSESNFFEDNYACDNGIDAEFNGVSTMLADNNFCLP
jgi:parallel beta-helix repeat protein